MDDIDRRLLDRLQNNFPLTSRPYRELGEEMELGEDEVIRRIRDLIKSGAVRRLGPIINLERLGGSGTLVAMRIPEHDVERVAALVSEYPEVSHNYLRPAEYNLWFTLSSLQPNRIQEILEEIEQRTGYKTYNLPTTRKFKIGVRFNITEDE